MTRDKALELRDRLNARGEHHYEVGLTPPANRSLSVSPYYVFISRGADKNRIIVR